MVSGGSGATGTGAATGSGTADGTPGRLRLRAPSCGGWGSGSPGRAGTQGAFLPSSDSRPELGTRRSAPRGRSQGSAAAAKAGTEGARAGREPGLARGGAGRGGLRWEHLVEFTA